MKEIWVWAAMVWLVAQAAGCGRGADPGPSGQGSPGKGLGSTRPARSEGNGNAGPRPVRFLSDRNEMILVFLEESVESKPGAIRVVGPDGRTEVCSQGPAFSFGPCAILEYPDRSQAVIVPQLTAHGTGFACYDDEALYFAFNCAESDLAGRRIHGFDGTGLSRTEPARLHHGDIENAIDNHVCHRGTGDRTDHGAGDDGDLSWTTAIRPCDRPRKIDKEY